MSTIKNVPFNTFLSFDRPRVEENVDQFSHSQMFGSIIVTICLWVTGLASST
jgi:hypothetical protein